jgi:hypothetical protein
MRRSSCCEYTFAICVFLVSAIAGVFAVAVVLLFTSSKLGASLDTVASATSRQQLHRVASNVHTSAEPFHTLNVQVHTGECNLGR